jgi:hypothetical protein
VVISSLLGTMKKDSLEPGLKALAMAVLRMVLDLAWARD